MYKETILHSVEGIGHFEPLRHYAEVHLILEPLERGAGLIFDTNLSTDVLADSWQRLILTHLQEKQHLGVLIGAPITDMRITLCAGRAHLKHTEGGDFRQATYRAVRQGLMSAESVLLEPYYRFRLTVPMEQYGRAVTDLRNLGADFAPPTDDGSYVEIVGRSSVRSLEGYPQAVIAYSRGKGRLFCTFGGYDVCHDSEAIRAQFRYDPEADLENTPDSVFCAHGAGFPVKWNKVSEYMHLETSLRSVSGLPCLPSPKAAARNMDLEEKELQAIMLRYFGRNDLTAPPAPQRQRTVSPAPRAAAAPKKQHLIVDGYNVIFAWDGLKELAADNLGLARNRLMDLLSSYCGYRGADAVLVFDGYRVQGSAGQTVSYHGLQVVYTKQDETADIYIQKFASSIGKNESVRVVSSDGLIRLSALQSGILRTSAQDFLKEIEAVCNQISSLQKELSRSSRTVLGDITKLQNM